MGECRAYKLGKKRWSYNQCQLVLHKPLGNDPMGQVLEVHECQALTCDDDLVHALPEVSSPAVARIQTEVQ